MTTDTRDPVVLSKWVLASGRVMPQQPEVYARLALVDLKNRAWNSTFTDDERREVLDAITVQMGNELWLERKGRG